MGIKGPSPSLLISFGLKSILLNIRIVTPASFLDPFAWKIFFPILYLEVMSILDVEVWFLDAEDGQNIATLSYTYAGQHVGSTNLYLTGNNTLENEFQNGEDANSQDATDSTSASDKEEVRLIKINLRDVGIAVFSTLLAAVVIFLTIRIAKDHDIDINPISRWRTWRNNKNSFLNGNRKRYRSRKRNRRWK